MNTPDANSLFLQIFSHTINDSDSGPVTTLKATDWGRIWIECCRVAKTIEDAQELAERAANIAERPTWSPPDED